MGGGGRLASMGEYVGYLVLREASWGVAVYMKSRETLYKFLMTHNSLIALCSGHRNLPCGSDVMGSRVRKLAVGKTVSLLAQSSPNFVTRGSCSDAPSVQGQDLRVFDMERAGVHRGGASHHGHLPPHRRAAARRPTLWIDQGSRGGGCSRCWMAS